MVSKTPTKTTTTTFSPSPKAGPFSSRRSDRRPKRRSSPLKLLATSLYRSAKPCIRRLITAFSRVTTAASTHRQHRLRLLKALQDSHPLLHDDDDGLCSPKRPTAFLDLDETLVHSTPDTPPPRFDFVVRPVINGHAMTFYVLKRPGLDSLLSRISEKFEVVVFTAGLREYASLVLDRLDPTGTLITHRLYRDSCREVDGKLVKDLAAVGRELHRVVIVDDNPNSYSLQPENAVPIRPFVDDLDDRELPRLSGFFEVAEIFDDVRDAIKLYLSDERRDVAARAPPAADG